MYDPLKAKTKVVFYSAVAFLFGLGLASGLGWTNPSQAMPLVSEQPQVTEAAVRPALDLSDAFVAIAEEVTPAVVRIEVTKRAPRGQGAVPNRLRRFFDNPGRNPNQSPQRRIGGGSGFIVSADGYILTNDHVVSDADEITVWTRDRRRFEATLIGSDPTTDVAVIKIEDEGQLPTLSFGDADKVRVGEWILAVGNPGFGVGNRLDYTVTAGIVSALGRPLGLIGNNLSEDEGARFAIEDFIQTDAVINPGNSGGPMVNLRGQVVGINSAIATQSGFYQGYGFAIPINLARRVMEDLIEYGVVIRPWLGVAINPISDEDAEFFGLPSVAGILVTDVTDGGPAAEAGLRGEDVIVSLDGESVERVGHLQRKIAEHRPGDRVRVGYYRDRSLREAVVRLEEAPINTQPQPEAEVVVRTAERLGIQVQPLTRELARQLRYSESGGVIISDVVRGSPAGQRGVPVGWKILSIDHQEVGDPDDVRDILERFRAGEVVSLRLENQAGDRTTINIRLPRQ